MGRVEENERKSYVWRLEDDIQRKKRGKEDRKERNKKGGWRR